MLFVAGLILLAIFWTDIVNSKFASEYIQEMIIAEESRLSSAERSQLYEKIKEIIKQFGLLAIVALGAFLLGENLYLRQRKDLSLFLFQLLLERSNHVNLHI